jgi:hypothetical protein
MKRLVDTESNCSACCHMAKFHTSTNGCQVRWCPCKVRRVVTSAGQFMVEPEDEKPEVPAR